MEIEPIRCEADHEAALREIERLWGAESGTLDGDRLDVLLTLTEAWERRQHPIDAPDPIDAIKFRLEQQGLGPKDLVGILGTRSRVHEVLHRKRGLTLTMIRRLNSDLHIPAEVLIRDPRAI